MIDLERKEIVDIFLHFFTRQGYDFQPPSELITDDNSLLFTNDTIVPWKRHVRDGTIPKNGVCMKQPCLRLKGLNDTLSEEASTSTH
ncbi:MAG TPA: alanine--tRNA ligase-related protein [Candidatus Nanoarchaeia archaeon]|nr:alanine--tRNA ligase-related protein [Candidatus Nanoarchaeia archaeon]